MGRLLGSSMVGLTATSSKRAYATPRTAAPRDPAPAAGHCWPILCRRHWNTQRQVWLSLCGISWCAQSFVWALWASLVGMGFDSKWDLAPLTIFLGLLLCPWMWESFSDGIQHSPVDGYSAVNCNFGVLAGEDEHRNWAIANLSGKVSFHSNPKERQCQRMFKIPHNCSHLTH